MKILLIAKGTYWIIPQIIKWLSQSSFKDTIIVYNLRAVNLSIPQQQQGINQANYSSK